MFFVETRLEQPAVCQALVEMKAQARLPEPRTCWVALLIKRSTWKPDSSLCTHTMVTESKFLNSNPAWILPERLFLYMEHLFFKLKVCGRPSGGTVVKKLSEAPGQVENCRSLNPRP